MRACASTSDGHFAGTQPNLRDSGHSAPAPSQSTRQNMRAPCLGGLGGARHLLDLGHAVHREQAHAELQGARDVALLLDRVAEGDALGRARRRSSASSTSATEAVSKHEPSEASRRSTLGSRVGLHRVEDRGSPAAPSEKATDNSRRTTSRSTTTQGPSSRRSRRNSRMRSVMRRCSSSAQAARYDV
jgi:hypothetical protein